MGGGPAGLLAATRVKWLDVHVYEARPKPGRPPHCAGLVSWETASLLPRESIREYYDGIMIVHARGELRVEARLVRIDRPLLEDLLAAELENLGHRLLAKTRVDAVRVENGRWVVASRWGAARYAAIVVAEGAAARITRMIGLNVPHRYLHGYQVVMRLDARLSGDPIVWLRRYGAYYSWLVPLDYGRRALVGAAAPRYSSAAAAVGRIRGKLGGVIEERRMGLIPFAPPLRRVCGRLRGARYCIYGDAAAHVKATSGGGLYAITRLAGHIAACIEGRGCGEAMVKSVTRTLLRLYMLAKLYYETPVSQLFDLAASLLGCIQLASYDELRVTRVGCGAGAAAPQDSGRRARRRGSG